MKLAMQGAALAAAALASFAPASAQTSNSLSVGTAEMMTRVSAGDVTAMMAELGVASELKADSEGSPPYIVATVPGGGRFLFHFFNCDVVATAGNCAHTVVSTAFASAGVTYDEINDFNRNASVTTGVNIGEQQIIILARNIIVFGGHSRELFKGTVYLFLRDVQNFADRKPPAASVRFSPAPQNTSKIAGLAVREADGQAPKAFGITDFTSDVAVAIANTSEVRFSVDYESGL